MTRTITAIATEPQAVTAKAIVAVYNSTVAIVGPDNTRAVPLMEQIFGLRELATSVAIDRTELRNQKHRHGRKAHTALRRRDQNTRLRGNRGIDVDYANGRNDLRERDARNDLRERDARNDLREQEVERNNEWQDTTHQYHVMMAPVFESAELMDTRYYEDRSPEEQTHLDEDAAWSQHDTSFTQDEIDRQVDDAWAMNDVAPYNDNADDWMDPEDDENDAIALQRLADFVDDYIDTLGEL